jgi:hypothetical protein
MKVNSMYLIDFLQKNSVTCSLRGYFIGVFFATTGILTGALTPVPSRRCPHVKRTNLFTGKRFDIC